MGTGINLQQILKTIEAKSPKVWGPRKSMTMTNLQRMRFASVESKGEEHLLTIIYNNIYKLYIIIINIKYKYIIIVNISYIIYIWRECN